MSEVKRDTLPTLLNASRRPVAFAARRRWLSLAVLLTVTAGASLFVIINQRVAANPLGVTVAAPLQGGAKFSNFSHNSPREHGAFMTDPSRCSSCHRRDQNAEPRFPGHKACTDCHLAQFVQQDIPMCAICHDTSKLNQGLSVQNPGLTRFPRLRSFNMEFNHDVHDAGAARPAAGCASCHTPINRRIAMSIPDGFAAHNNCYDCHKPNTRSSSGRDIGSCATCHMQRPYVPSRTTARAFRAGFSHADHGARQGMSCASCHNVNGIVRQAQNVPAPRVAFHTTSTRAQSCMTCHNDKRVIGGKVVFGDADFNDCKRCHTGSTFHMGP